MSGYEGHGHVGPATAPYSSRHYARHFLGGFQAPVRLREYTAAWPFPDTCLDSPSSARPCALSDARGACGLAATASATPSLLAATASGKESGRHDCPHAGRGS